ncbi:hypothetical protein D3C76_1074210 [compost metagenome]
MAKPNQAYGEQGKHREYMNVDVLFRQLREQQRAQRHTQPGNRASQADICCAGQTEQVEHLTDLQHFNVIQHRTKQRDQGNDAHFPHRKASCAGKT